MDYYFSHPFNLITLSFFFSSLVFSSPINSNSILVSLLDSHYTELSELIDKALLLQSLENLSATHNLTIFAPHNNALENTLDPEFKRFLLEPQNLKSLQTLILNHIVPSRVDPFRLGSAQVRALSNQHLLINNVEITQPNSIITQDGMIHGIDKLLIPQSVIQEFNLRRQLRSISAVHPTGAPTMSPRKPGPSGSHPHQSPPPTFAPASAPAPAPGPHHHYDGVSQVKDFISILVNYGSYNEVADILVNLTSLATEMGRLVSEGYVITVLAPNDEAMTKLKVDQLQEPGAAEEIMYYHIIPEYQTEESMYSAVRRFGKVRYETLRFPHRVVAEEADGSVRFGKGYGSGYLVDPDIYTDSRISVQGIDGVLFPVKEVKESARKVAAKQRRGKLLELACTLAGSFGLCKQ